MKKIAIISCLMLLAISAVQAQDYIVPEEVWYHTEVLGSNYHGYVFNKEWDVDILVENQDGRFTPEDIDIAKADFGSASMARSAQCEALSISLC